VMTSSIYFNWSTQKTLWWMLTTMKACHQQARLERTWWLERLQEFWNTVLCIPSIVWRYVFITL